MIEPDLLAQYLDGTLDEASRVKLTNDPAALGELADQVRIDAALRVQLGDATDVREAILAVIGGAPADELKSRILQETTGPSLWERWWRTWAIGLATATAILLCFLLFRPAVEPVRLVEIRGPVTIGHQPVSKVIGLRAGDVVRLRDAASATVQLADGTRLELSRGAELHVDSVDGKSLVLAAGKITAVVQKQKEPLTIRTPLAGVKVLGTAFDLEAREQATRLDVREGLVRFDHAQEQSVVEVAGGEFAMAVPRREIVAGVQPVTTSPGNTGSVARPFADDSPWNQALGKVRYAEIESPALDLAGHGAVVLPASQLRPVWFGKEGDPVTLVASRYTDEEFARVPVPAESIRGDWVNGTLIDTTKGVAYELVGARCGPAGIEAMWCAVVDLRSKGIPPEASGNLHSGLPAVAGMIRAGELKAGIRHALSVAALHEGLNRNVLVAPARRMPLELAKLERMGAAGNVGFGTRLAIPREVDVTKLGLSEPALAVARALQEYGAIVTHSHPSLPAGGAGDWKQPHLQLVADETMDGLDWRQLAAEVSQLAATLKVVTP
jgi:hypothetical protein